MNLPKEQVEAGQAVYAKRGLRLYGLVLLSLTSPLIW